jgi:hypothetical protein
MRIQRCAAGARALSLAGFAGDEDQRGLATRLCSRRTQWPSFTKYQCVPAAVKPTPFGVGSMAARRSNGVAFRGSPVLTLIFHALGDPRIRM